MPKKIENVKEKILNVATKMFIKYPYDNVDIRTIVKNSGIAVGTFYNYFPNKKQLFREVVYQSWIKTIYKLKSIVESKNKIDDKIDEFIYQYYEDIEARKGIGRKLMRIEVIDLDEQNFMDHNYSFFDQIRDKIVVLIIELIRQKYLLEDNLYEVEITDLAESIYLMISGYFYLKKEKQNYVEHILKMMDAYVKQNLLTK